MSTFAGIAFLLFLAGEDRLELARKLEASGQHAPAIAEYQKALEASPAQAGIWVELAQARLAAGQIPGAIGDFSRAVRLDPTGLAAQKGLATAVEKSGNPQRALVEWRRVAQLAQGADLAEAESHVDSILQSLGQAPKAPVADTAHAAVKPADHKAPPSSSPKSVQVGKDEPAEVKKAVELWKDGKRDKALDMLRGIIKKKPGAEAYYYAGVMRLEEKKLDMAEFNLKKATGDKTLGGSAWYWLGRAQEARKKPKEAREAFKKSLEASPKGEFAAEAKARLEDAKPVEKHAAPEPDKNRPKDAKPETAPPVLPDSLRSPYSWAPPEMKIPSGDGSAAGKMIDEAAKQLSQKQNDLALSTMEQLRLKESASPSAELGGLVGAVAYNAMGLPANAVSQTQSFLKEHPSNAYADYAKFIEGVSFLRLGKPDSAAALLGPLPIAPKGAMWTESARQSAMGEALRLSGKHPESVAALKLALQAEPDPKAKRSLALRLAREAAKAGSPLQGQEPLSEARKGCDKSAACLEVSVSLADLLWAQNKVPEAGAIYDDIAKTWPHSTEAPWAVYQTGNVQARQGRRVDAQATWKGLIERSPSSYWAAQARLRLEDAVWKSRYQETK